VWCWWFENNPDEAKMFSYLNERNLNMFPFILSFFCIQKERFSMLLSTLTQRSYEKYVMVRTYKHEREHGTRITSYLKTYRILHVLYNKNHPTVEFIEEIKRYLLNWYKVKGGISGLQHFWDAKVRISTGSTENSLKVWWSVRKYQEVTRNL
jgi:hypothetical protein